MTNKEVMETVEKNTEELYKLYKNAEKNLHDRKLHRTNNPSFSFKDAYLRKVKNHLTV
jgi:hypothetical protein